MRLVLILSKLLTASNWISQYESIQDYLLDNKNQSTITQFNEEADRYLPTETSGLDHIKMALEAEFKKQPEEE